MATSVVSSLHRSIARASAQKTSEGKRGFTAGLVTALTVAAVLIHGYHPFAEDGGLYLAGIKRVLNPELYPYGTDFVLGHLRFSFFAPAIATLVHWSRLPVETVLFAVYLATVWVTLAAGWMLACRCFSEHKERVGAVTLLAAWLPLPIAGTSLMLMDPYVTARSISTPCVLLALVGALDFVTSVRNGERWQWRGLAIAIVALGAAGLVHPLMAAYGFGCVLALGTTVAERPGVRLGALLGLCGAGVIVAAVLQMVAQPESPAYYSVAISRYYWFLSQWHWYELVGLVAPLAIIGAAAWYQSGQGGTARRALANMAIGAGVSAIVVALLFARIDSATHLVARLQPLRIFQPVYIVMILFVGAALSRWMGGRRLRWIGGFATLAMVMFGIERQTFPNSSHLELPSLTEANHPTNAWQQAFAWIRVHTPVNAVFALDADYITRPGEDAQNFRAIAERSMLPDYSKDGGEAAITPSLTPAWTAGQRAQANLSERSDAERVAMLAPEGVGWVVLERNAATSFACEYANSAVKVCRLPRIDTTDGARFSLRSQPALPQQVGPATR